MWHEADCLVLLYGFAICLHTIHSLPTTKHISNCLYWLVESISNDCGLSLASVWCLFSKRVPLLSTQGKQSRPLFGSIAELSLLKENSLWATSSHQLLAVSTTSLGAWPACHYTLLHWIPSWPPITKFASSLYSLSITLRISQVAMLSRETLMTLPPFILMGNEECGQSQQSCGGGWCEKLLETLNWHDDAMMQ